MRKGNGFSITAIETPGGKTVWQVYGVLNGERVRIRKPNELEAITCKQSLERQAMNLAPLPAITTNDSMAAAIPRTS